MARVFIESNARKFREDRLSISLDDRKKDTRQFDVTYIYLEKRYPFCHSSNILIVLFDINANNTGTHMFFGRFITERIYCIRVIFVCFVQEIESDFRSKSYIHRVFLVIIYLISLFICSCAKSFDQQKVVTFT